MSFSLFCQVGPAESHRRWMILVLLALRPLLKKAPRRFSCLLWGLVAIRLALPFSFESRVSMVPQAAAAPQKIAQALNPGQMNWVSPAALAANPLPACRSCRSGILSGKSDSPGVGAGHCSHAAVCRRELLPPFPAGAAFRPRREAGVPL